MSLSLDKGATLSLKKDDGTALESVTLGLGWDAAKTSGFFGGGTIDLDASAIVLDANRNVLDLVWYSKLLSNDSAIRHTGDNLTGDGDGDDEQITVELSRISRLTPEATTIVLVITSYSRQTFDKVKNVHARVVDNATGQEFVKYNLSDGGSSTAKVVAKLSRDAAGVWAFTAIGNDANGRTVKNVIADAQAVA